MLYRIFCALRSAVLLAILACAPLALAGERIPKRVVEEADKITVHMQCEKHMPTVGGSADSGLVGFPGGSGFFAFPGGYVAVAAHVLQNASTCEIFWRGTVYPVKITGRDQWTDLAMLKVDTRDAISFPYAAFGDTSFLRRGEGVYGAGFPSNLSVGLPAVRAGVIAHTKARPPDPSLFFHHVATDVQNYYGDSGGPQFTDDGRVIGMNTQLYEGSSLTFFVPMNTFTRSMLWRLRAGDVTYSEVNITQSIDVPYFRMHKEVRHAYVDKGLPPPPASLREGLIVVEMAPEGVAGRSGKIAPGDVITHVDGKHIRDMTDFSQAVYLVEPGTPVRLTIRRGETVFDVTLVTVKEVLK